MPAQSRAQRRRANQQKQATGPRQPGSQKIQPSPLDEVAITAESVALDEQNAAQASPAGRQAAAPLPSYGTRPARQQVRQTRQAVNRPTPAALAPIDYSEDYRHAKRDLIRIFIWSALLFAGMFIIHFTGIL